MPLPELTREAVHVGAEASSWREAIGLVGEALVRGGFTEPSYTGRMIGVIEEFGPYIVIAPGLALAHARPGDDVRREGLCVVTLREPVAFGHPHNDPVGVIIGLAVTTAESHVADVAELANIFNDPSSLPALEVASSTDEVLAVMRAGGGGAS